MNQSGIRDWPCPKCGGEVEWWYYSDCSYNDSSGEECRSCGNKLFRKKNKVNGLEKAKMKAEDAMATKKKRFVIQVDYGALKKGHDFFEVTEDRLQAEIEKVLKDDGVRASEIKIWGETDIQIEAAVTLKGRNAPKKKK
jgi:hypothetical protein